MQSSGAFSSSPTQVTFSFHYTPAHHTHHTIPHHTKPHHTTSRHATSPSHHNTITPQRYHTTTLSSPQQNKGCAVEVNEDSSSSSSSSSEDCQCGWCGQPINDRHVMRVRGSRSKWHASCFRCCVCQVRLQGEVTCFCRADNIYCRNDYSLQRFVCLFVCLFVCVAVSVCIPLSVVVPLSRCACGSK